MLRYLRVSVPVFTILLLVTGVIYPLLVTGIAQLVFPIKANGSQIVAPDGRVIGSHLIGQFFNDPKYFWGRPSGTAVYAYNASLSGGSNLGPNNPILVQQVLERISTLYAADPENQLPVPVDLVTMSASGLDPDISIAAAYYQAARIAQVRNIPIDDVNRLIEIHTINPVLGFIGEERVNVLELNLSLDALE